MIKILLKRFVSAREEEPWAICGRCKRQLWRAGQAVRGTWFYDPCHHCEPAAVPNRAGHFVTITNIGEHPLTLIHNGSNRIVLSGECRESPVLHSSREGFKLARHFYSDIVAAAWMQRRHGLKLCLTPDEPGRATSWPMGVETIMRGTHSEHRWEVLRLEDPALWYVHKDSLELLKPREGDEVAEDGRILARGGVAFITPEVEV